MRLAVSGVAKYGDDLDFVPEATPQLLDEVIAAGHLGMCVSVCVCVGDGVCGCVWGGGGGGGGY